mmetsp:Transcript_25939/g.76019  ORF Transcript_25939/g.76019 Transcript_25939/m.76019 type:complete len:455 (-) Transcript_25939:165-1529(-)
MQVEDVSTAPGPDAGSSSDRSGQLHRAHTDPLQHATSDDEAHLAELARLVNSRAYRSRQPSIESPLMASRMSGRSQSSTRSQSLTRRTSRRSQQVELIASLANVSSAFDPNTDLTTIRKLGQGAFATVDLCKISKADVLPPDSESFRTGLVAVKRLRLDRMIDEPLEYDNFLTEAALVKTLIHPKIVQCYGCIEYTDAEQCDRACLLLEYLPGGSLRTRMHAADYSAKTAIGWLVDIAEGMAYLHAVHNLGIAHRDLKPDNVLLAEDGTAKIADMGMARIAIKPKVAPAAAAGPEKSQRRRELLDRPDADDASISITGRTGTPRYMAPENWAGEMYSNKVDVFSFGILAYEMLVAHRAYQERELTADQLMEEVAMLGLRPAIPKGWPPNLINLITACWAPDPVERPEFSEVAEELKSLRAAVEAHSKLNDQLERVLHPQDPRHAPKRSSMCTVS